MARFILVMLLAARVVSFEDRVCVPVLPMRSAVRVLFLNVWLLLNAGRHRTLGGFLLVLGGEADVEHAFVVLAVEH